MKNSTKHCWSQYTSVKQIIQEDKKETPDSLWLGFLLAVLAFVFTYAGMAM